LEFLLPNLKEKDKRRKAKTPKKTEKLLGFSPRVNNTRTNKWKRTTLCQSHR
jgi:hypothetical protein